MKREFALFGLIWFVWGGMGKRKRIDDGKKERVGKREKWTERERDQEKERANEMKRIEKNEENEDMCEGREVYVGSRDVYGRPHGRGSISFFEVPSTSCSLNSQSPLTEFHGHFQHGKRQGRGTLVFLHVWTPSLSHTHSTSSLQISSSRSPSPQFFFWDVTHSIRLVFYFIRFTSFFNLGR